MKKTFDLSNLSREQKLELIVLLEEKSRRERDKRPVFADRASQEQLDVLRCDEIERFVFAGNGFGKTALGAEDTRCAITGHNPYNGISYAIPCRAYIVLDKPEKIENVILPELRKWMNIKPEQLHKKGKPYVSEISFEDTGSWIKFIFWDQDPMTAEGIEADYIWFDEPPPRKLFISLRRAGRTKGRRARYLITGTPLASPWLRTEVYEPWSKGERKNCMCFRGHTEANKQNLADGYIEQFSAILSEKEKGIRLRGEFFDLEGLALSHLFRRDSHTLRRNELDWNERNPCVIVFDPHPSKAHHAVLLGADRDGYLYVLEEYKEKVVARRFMERIIKRGWFERYRVLDIIYDSLGSSEMTSGEGFLPFGTVINEVLSKQGLGRARATSYDEKNDEDFITRIQDALLIPTDPNNFGECIPKLRIMSDCIGTIADIENVQWAKDKRIEENKPHLDITHKDFLSCLKYGLAANLTFGKKKDRIFYPKAQVYGIDLKTGIERRTIRIKSKQNKSGKSDDDDDEWDSF